MVWKKITCNSSCLCVICEDPDADYFEGKKHPCDFFISGGIYCKYSYVVHIDEVQHRACGNNDAILCMVENNK
jgi:hypothetical protein